MKKREKKSASKRKNAKKKNTPEIMEEFKEGKSGSEQSHNEVESPRPLI